MSDERIDLTQFDGVTPGPWTHNPLIGTMVSGVRAGEDARESAFNGNDPDYQALFHIPEMIAELKRCYDLIDKLRKQPVSISCETCSQVYDEGYLHEMLEIGPNGECVMCLEEASE